MACTSLVSASKGRPEMRTRFLRARRTGRKYLTYSVMSSHRPANSVPSSFTACTTVSEVGRLRDRAHYMETIFSSLSNARHSSPPFVQHK